LNNANREAAQASDIFRTVTCFYSAAIFVEVPIVSVNDVVAAVLDGPVAAVYSENVLAICLFRWTAGDADGKFHLRLLNLGV